LDTETIGAPEHHLSFRVDELVIDCADPSKLARFWSAALGYEIYEDEADIAAIEDTDGPGPAICFQKVPESKQGKNRVHFDLNVDDDELSSAVAHLVGLGATRLDSGENPEKAWVVLADPEGNEFCVVA
jgi:predicted enzyme related to lactoylglutathione lyase